MVYLQMSGSSHEDLKNGFSGLGHLLGRGGVRQEFDDPERKNKRKEPVSFQHGRYGRAH